MLNFSFWSDLSECDRFAVTWRDGCDGKGGKGSKTWTGYWSLLAALHRGELLSIPHMLFSSTRLNTSFVPTRPFVVPTNNRAAAAREDGIDIVKPLYYSTCPEADLLHVFRSDTSEAMPLLEDRIRLMREAGRVLCYVRHKKGKT